jgi:hypothetical protein
MLIYKDKLRFFIATQASKLKFSHQALAFVLTLYKSIKGTI